MTIIKRPEKSSVIPEICSAPYEQPASLWARAFGLSGRALNVRFLACMVVGLFLLATAVVVLHAVEVRHNAGALKRRAESALEEKRPADAARYLQQYLGYAPEDNAARLALAGLLDQKPEQTLKEKAKVIDLYERVLRDQPERVELRRGLIDRKLAVRRFADALGDLKLLLEGPEPAHHANGELEQLAGFCHAVMNQKTDAIKYYKLAITHAPQHLPTYSQLAELLAQSGEEEKLAEADKYIAQLVDHNATNHEAYLASARYQRRHGRRDAAIHDVERAYQLAPTNLDTLLAMAEVAETRRQFARARDYLQKALAANPTEGAVFLALARVDMSDKRSEQAVACLRRGLTAVAPANRIALLHQLGICLLQSGKTGDVQEIMHELAAAHAAQTVQGHLQALLYMSAEEWGLAAGTLEITHAKLQGEGEAAAQVSLLLGTCYEKLMEPDRALGAYRQASAENAQPLPAHLGAATALITLKRFDEAIQEYEHFIVAEAPQFGPTLAKLLVLRNMRAEASSQDWERVERVLQDALKVEPQSSSVPLVRAQMWMVRNRPEQAREVLQVACKEHPRDAELWLALADTEMLRGHFERGLAVLKDAQDRYLGDCVELRLAQARYWERQYQNRPRDVSRALTDLENNLASFKPREQAHLLRDLGEIHYRLLHNDDAKRLWQHVAAMQPRDIQVRLVLFDIAIKARALAEAGDLVEQIRRIEGADGTQWRFAQASLLMASQQRDKSKADHDNLHYARQLLNEVAAKRSGWAATIRGLAALDDLEDNTQSALKRFAQAFDLGDRDPDALRRAIQLMYARRQYEDADRLLNELAKRGSLPVDLLSLEASLLSQQGEHARAIESARKAVRRGSKDLPDYIWLGQILQAGGEKYHQEAEAILRKATQLPGAENDPACWVALVHFLAATRQPDKAAAAVDVASRKLTSPTSDLALADCYEAIKQHQKARARLQAAFTRQPWDFDAVRSIATFYFRRHQLANAEPYFARLLDARVKAGEEERKWAFCFLTICRAHAGDFRAFEDVRIFLEKYLEANGSSAGNLRLQAMLLSAHPHYRRHALQILQDLRSRAVLTPEDQMSLGQLYEATAEWARAREIYGALARVELDSAEKQVLFIRNYVLALVRHQEPEVAANWLEALLQRDPDSEQTLSARVRVLKLQGQAAQAHALLQRYAQKPGVNPGVVAALFEESGQPAAALDFYRQAAKRAGNPGKLMLANFFIRQGHIEEALDLCDEAASAGLVEEAAALAVSALEMHGGASPLQFERVHKLLGDALLKQPASPALLTKMALLYNLQGNYTQAEALYRKVLQGDPNDLTALNNLAFLLTFKADRNWEMLNLLKRALDSAGPLPTLLDTRALVSLRLGNRAQALSDLDQAIADSPSAELYFHRAQAQQALERDTAIASLKKARALNLTRNSLHPLERPSYDELLKTLGG